MQSSLFDSNINSGTCDCQNTSTYETATKSSHENPEQARGVLKQPKPKARVKRQFRPVEINARSALRTTLLVRKFAERKVAVIVT